MNDLTLTKLLLAYFFQGAGPERREIVLESAYERFKDISPEEIRRIINDALETYKQHP